MDYYDQLSDLTKIDFDITNTNGHLIGDASSKSTKSTSVSSPIESMTVNSLKTSGIEGDYEDDDEDEINHANDNGDTQNSILDTYMEEDVADAAVIDEADDYEADEEQEDGEPPDPAILVSIPARQQSLARISVDKLMEMGYKHFFSGTSYSMKQAIEQWTGVLTSKERSSHLWAVLQALLQIAIASKQQYADSHNKADLISSYVHAGYGFNLLAQYCLAFYTSIQRREAQRRLNPNGRRANTPNPDTSWKMPNPYHLAWLQIVHQVIRSESLANSLSAAQLAQRAGEGPEETISATHQSSSTLGKLSWSLFSSSSVDAPSLPASAPAATDGAKQPARTVVERGTDAKERDEELRNLLSSPHVLLSPALAYLLQDYSLFFAALHIDYHPQIRHLQAHFQGGNGKFGDSVAIKPVGKHVGKSIYGWLDFGLDLLARWHLAFPLPEPFSALLVALSAPRKNDEPVGLLAGAGSVAALIKQILGYYSENGSFRTVNSWQDAALKNSGLKRSNSSPQNPDSVQASVAGSSHLQAISERTDSQVHQHSRSKSLTDASRLLAGNGALGPKPSTDLPGAKPTTTVPLMRISYFHGQLICYEAQLYATLALALFYHERFPDTGESSFSPVLLSLGTSTGNKSHSSETDVAKLVAQELNRRALSLLNLLGDVLDAVGGSAASHESARTLKLLSLGRTKGIIPEIKRKINNTLEYIHSIESRMSIL